MVDWEKGAALWWVGGFVVKYLGGGDCRVTGR